MNDTIRFTAKNTLSGETHNVVTDLDELYAVLSDGYCRCCGPCECQVEPDGVCPNGWLGLEQEAMAHL